MQHNMERWYSATRQRLSVRRYAGEPADEDMNALREAAALLSVRGVRIELGMAESAFIPGLGKANISGTTCFAAFIKQKGAEDESVGYLGEAFILECTALGLGTCWAGASYNRASLKRTLTLDAGEKLRLVTAVGIPEQKCSPRPRKPLDNLTGLDQEQLAALPEWQKRAIECARIAPSAVNAQPWEFVLGENDITVRRTGMNFGYGALDCGIAMLHIELGAAHCGVTGEWQKDGAENKFCAL